MDNREKGEREIPECKIRKRHRLSQFVHTYIIKRGEMIICDLGTNSG